MVLANKNRSDRMLHYMKTRSALRVDQPWWEATVGVGSRSPSLTDDVTLRAEEKQLISECSYSAK